jgi:hypothetical protein
MNTGDTDLDLAKALMDEYAEATGVVGAASPRRYLWTDAFGVCTLLGLAAETGTAEYESRARILIDQVHRTLGRHREDDARSGWISGLSETEGERHPTRGGLRIGKRLPERGPGEPFEEGLEWERDGQYFHYLTRWMHALHCAWAHLREEPYLRWARELAETAHGGFVRDVPGMGRRMVWKMSIDLSRPLVSSMGQHDPLDGLITYLELETASGTEETASGTDGSRGRGGGGVDLRPCVAEAERMCVDAAWATPDPLGIGGLLTDAGRLGSMIAERNLGERRLMEIPPRRFFGRLLEEGEKSLDLFRRSFSPRAPAERRLAFRELGLSIGLHTLEHAAGLSAGDPELGRARAIADRHSDLALEIETFWSEPASRRAGTWRDHEDINTVMLATALTPGGYVDLFPGG